MPLSFRSSIILAAVCILCLHCSKNTEPSNNQPPAWGYSVGGYPVPAAAQAEDVSMPDQVIGTGTPESCHPDSFIAAVAEGGVITFNGGTAPFTITLDQPAKVFNDQNPDIVIDGGGIVTLSGGGTTRILYMNTCDSFQVWTTPHCQDQDHPRLTVQNITFIDGNSRGETEYTGGGAIWVRGGRFKMVNCGFYNNTCDSLGPDVGGAAVRVFSQYDGLPVYVTDCTFGAEGRGNFGANGGALSSIGVSWSIYNSYFGYNRAIGNGGNPAQDGTPGGGSGGAIYNDGNYMELRIYGSRFEYNQVNAYGAAVFFVTNDHSGKLFIYDTESGNNIGGSWHILPGVSMHSDTYREVENSVLE